MVGILKGLVLPRIPSRVSSTAYSSKVSLISTAWYLVELDSFGNTLGISLASRISWLPKLAIFGSPFLRKQGPQVCGMSRSSATRASSNP